MIHVAILVASLLTACSIPMYSRFISYMMAPVEPESGLLLLLAGDFLTLTGIILGLYVMNFIVFPRLFKMKAWCASAGTLVGSSLAILTIYKLPYAFEHIEEVIPYFVVPLCFIGYYLDLGFSRHKLKVTISSR